MTPDDIGKLSLAELEAIAARFAAAVETIKQAQALLGGVPASLPATQQRPVSQPTPVAPPSNINAAQQQALDEWRTNPERLRLMEQFKQQQGEDAQ